MLEVKDATLHYGAAQRLAKVQQRKMTCSGVCSRKSPRSLIMILCSSCRMTYSQMDTTHVCGSHPSDRFSLPRSSFRLMPNLADKIRFSLSPVLQMVLERNIRLAMCIPADKNRFS